MNTNYYSRAMSNSTTATPRAAADRAVGLRAVVRAAGARLPRSAYRGAGGHGPAAGRVRRPPQPRRGRGRHSAPAREGPSHPPLEPCRDAGRARGPRAAGQDAGSGGPPPPRGRTDARPGRNASSRRRPRRRTRSASSSSRSSPPSACSSRACCDGRCALLRRSLLVVPNPARSRTGEGPSPRSPAARSRG